VTYITLISFEGPYERDLYPAKKTNICKELTNHSHTTVAYMVSGKLDEILHGVTVVIPTNDREIPGSTPGRYNLQIQITSTS